ERGRLAHEPREAPGELLHDGLGEAGPDLAAVHQPAAFVRAEQQGGERAPALVRGLVTADDELLAVAALDLEPGAAAPAGVAGIGALCDDAFAPLAAHLLQHARTV